MTVVPTSARVLAALATAVCLWPLVTVTMTFGVGGSILHVIAAVSAAACAVPVFYREQGPFRIACAAAGAVVAVASLPLLFVGSLAAVGLGGWSVFLVFLFPTAAIPALIAAFQRARGRQFGLVAAAFGWFAAVASVAGWVLTVSFVAAWHLPA
ncbi:hypothetical protein BX285_2967 [Streptomyces sp. 1114.5]|uniref:hypothetical protein n=1 Tax=unclassified Streptomyces TaxID=2593676 RepID=UPI000BCE237E|nr:MULTISPECIES: hypothetical protein [unclassified Streptomyces]RKT18538.1 hypothetical protein BX285_2967 [Streptomyces sp. 1114.5]SOB84740.1 hypothetical protein SAMN06272789_5001 [Streptomyces sp. 1331.2]